jgi:hypothetical protein
VRVTCAAWAARPDSARYDRAEGGLNDDSNAVYVPDGNTAASTPADAYVVAVGEKAYAEGLGDNPAPPAAA